MEPAVLRVLSSIHRALLIALGLAPTACGSAQRAGPGPEPQLDFAFDRGSEDARPRAPEKSPRRDAEACEPQRPGLAWLDCARERILVAHPVVFQPGRSIPPEPARSVLDAVAALMHERQEILLVRIEAYAARNPGDSATARRRELDATQGRADAVLAYLWRKRGISAERLEAVGYGFDSRRTGGAASYSVVFRVVQRSETVPAGPAVR